MDYIILLDRYDGQEGPDAYAASFRGTLAQCRAERAHDGTTYPIPKSDFDAVFEEATHLSNGLSEDAGGIYALQGKPLMSPERRVAASTSGAISSGFAALRAGLLLPLLATGCGVVQPDRVIENRFSARSVTATTNPEVRIAVTSAPVPPAAADAGVRITELSDHGQAALIAANAGKPPVILPVPAADATPAILVANTISRRLVVAVRPAGFLLPGDRVDAIRVRLAVAPAQAAAWRIASWTQASNGQQVIAIGTLTDVATRSVSGSVGVAAAKFLPEISATATANRTQAREIDLKDTTDFDAAVDNEGSAWLDETAGWRVNLAHNLSIDVTIAAPSSTLGPLPSFIATGLWSTPKTGAQATPRPAHDVQLRAVTRFVPLDDAHAVCGVATLTYRIRHITNAAGRATFSESDDVVASETHTTSAGFLLAPPAYTPLYALDTGGQRTSLWDMVGKQHGLQFTSLEEALAFRDWMQRRLARGGAIANGTISLAARDGRPRPIGPAEISGLVPIVANEAKHAAAQKEEATACPD